MKKQTNVQQRPTLRLPSRVIQLVIAFDFVFICMLMQYFLSSSAQFDQAEQLLWSQELRLGYGKQPPLYTWLVAVLFQFTGASLGVLLAFKFVLLFGFLCLVMHMGRLLAFDSKQTTIALLGYALLPTFVWYSVRDLTHTVLALVLSALVLRQAILLLGLGSRTLAPQKHKYSHYVLLGLWVGLGVMAKYNVVVFATGLLLVLLFVPPFRQRVSPIGLLLAVLVSLLVASPHIWWFVQNSGEAVETVYRHAKSSQVGSVGWHTILSGKTWGNMLAFAMPFAPCVGLLMYRKKNQNRGQTTNARLQEAMETLQQDDAEDVTNANRLLLAQEQYRFFATLFVATTVVTVCVLALAGIYGLRDRWMLPIWFFLPIWLAACIGKIAQPSMRMVRLYAAAAVAFMLFSIFEHPVKVFAGDSYVGKPVRANAPYVQIATDILKDVQTETGVTCPEVVLVAGDKVTLASGNFRRVLDCADAVYGVDHLPARYLHPPPASVLLICKGSTCSEDDAWMPPQWRSAEISAEISGGNWQHTPFKQNEWKYQHSTQYSEVYEWSLYQPVDAMQ